MAFDGWTKSVKVGMALVFLGVALLPGAAYVRDELTTSVGADSDSDLVFVDRDSDAAQRGYALPGEGTAARRIVGQLSRSQLILTTATALIVAGVTVSVLALAASRKLYRFSGLSSAIGRLLKTLTLGSLGALLIGAIVGVMTFVPTKTVSDAAFNMSFAAVVIAAVLACVVWADKIVDDG